MKVLVFLEHHGDEIRRDALGVLSKVASLGEEVSGVLIGDTDVKELAAEAARFGATTVHVATDDMFEPPLPQPRVDVLAGVVQAGGYDTVLFANSVLCADIAAGLAARLDAGLNWDLVDLVVRDGELIGRRFALGDSVQVEVGWRSSRRLGLCRSGSFEAIVTGGDSPQLDNVIVSLEVHSSKARTVERTVVQDSGRSLQDAEIIVAGGMGLGGPEHFALAEELAQVLGGAVAATRAAVYAGWYPYSAQVGQTGKTVTPKLYVALGISGAIQHKVGMQNSKVIISINKDPGAPIFEFSDLAVVGDLHTIVPQLVELIRQRKGQG